MGRSIGLGRCFEFVCQFPIPSKKNRYKIHKRGNRRWIGKAEEVVNAEIAVALIARTALPKDLKTPIRVEIFAQQSKSRKRLQDGDNLVGVIFDGMVKSGRIPDDSFAIIPQHEVRFEGREKDEVRVRVIELG
jgi:Holliday junction resolvase RusA-like endonuclease